MRLRRALDEFVVDGVETTLPLFRTLVRNAEIQNGQYDIHWLEAYLKTGGSKASRPGSLPGGPLGRSSQAGPPPDGRGRGASFQNLFPSFPPCPTIHRMHGGPLDITPEILLKAYAAGIFPMAEDAEDPGLFWVEPRERGVLPLTCFHVGKRLARTVRSDISRSASIMISTG